MRQRSMGMFATYFQMTQEAKKHAYPTYPQHGAAWDKCGKTVTIDDFKGRVWGCSCTVLSSVLWL